MEIKLLHLYYDLMNLYGEYGNIKILEKHLKTQGFEVIVDRRTIGEQKKFNDYDFIYMGCGTERNQEIVAKDLLSEKEELKEAIENNKIILFTGNSFEILGKTVNQKETLSIFKLETDYVNRITTDVIFTSEIFENKIVGFINTMGNVKNNEHPLFKVEWGLKQETEGLAYKNLIGTHLIGPLLIRNPEILKSIIKRICVQKDAEYKEIEKEYEDEERAYNIVLQELENRKEQE